MKKDEVRQHASPAVDVGFLKVVFAVSALAAVMTWLTVSAGFKPWVMFLAWTAYGLGKGSERSGLCAIAAMFGGVVISMLTTLGWLALQPHLPALALPIAVFLAVVVVFALSLVPPMDNVPACFLGLSTYFASQMEVSVHTFAYLGGGVVMGGAAAAMASLASRAIMAPLKSAE